MLTTDGSPPRTGVPDVKHPPRRTTTAATSCRRHSWPASHCPYTHIFFRLGDGSFIAFFDLGDDVAPAPSPNTPAWVTHLALRMDNLEALERTKTLLEGAGIEVLGVTDHRIFKSIYFFDPNGIRLELCAQIASEPQMIEESRSSHERLAEWAMRKQRWRADRIEAQATVQSQHPD